MRRCDFGKSLGRLAAFVLGVIAPFAAQAARGDIDFNGDGKADIVWVNGSTGSTSAWVMNGTGIASSAGLLNDPKWKVVATADFNGDGKSDILWFNASTGVTAIWLMNGTSVVGSAAVLTDANWRPLTTADFNGDGRADILWFNAATGTTAIWLMNGTAMAGAAGILTDPNWKVLFTADFNGDGKADLLWHNASTGTTAIWLMNGTSLAKSGGIVADVNWKATATADFDGDGKADILWYNAATGTTAIWLMNGTSLVRGAGILTDPDWKVIRTADFDADARADLVWYNETTGTTALWLMSGTTLVSAAGVLTDPNWKVIGAPDLNGDGKADLLWFNASSGTTSAWLMNGTAFAATAGLLYDANWAAQTSASVPTYPPSASPTLPPPAFTSDRATNAFNWTNYRRAQIGLAPFTRNALLDRAAAAHVNYITLNGSYLTEGHSETSGRAGFTGVNPSDRTLAAGYPDRTIGENIAGSTTTVGVDATDGLVDAPYHRQSQFGNFADAGAAFPTAPSSPFTASTYVIDFGGVNANPGAAANQLIVYPADGTTQAPIDWIANEFPNPVPDLAGQRVGYPVSIGTLTQALTVTRFTLADDRGVQIPVRLLTSRTDTNQSLRTFAFLVPLAPLASGMKYSARATGSMGTSGFDRTWSFTTAPLTPLVLTPTSGALDAAPGSSVTVTFSGGTGRSLSGYASLSYYYSGTPPSNVELFTQEIVSPGVLRIVRSNTPCSGSLISCFATIVGSDSAGTQVSLNIPVR